MFTAVAWASVGVGGRALILAAFTALALGVPVLVARRGLRGTAETFAAVGLLLVVLDGYAAWSVNLAGVAGWPGSRYAALVGGQRGGRRRVRAVDQVDGASVRRPAGRAAGVAAARRRGRDGCGRLGVGPARGRAAEPGRAGRPARPAGVGAARRPGGGRSRSWCRAGGCRGLRCGSAGQRAGGARRCWPGCRWCWSR
ncbi:hypothetical protein NKG94_42805 [Micromonospora sp. M12]